MNKRIVYAIVLAAGLIGALALGVWLVTRRSAPVPSGSAIGASEGATASRIPKAIDDVGTPVSEIPPEPATEPPKDPDAIRYTMQSGDQQLVMTEGEYYRLNHPLDDTFLQTPPEENAVPAAGSGTGSSSGSADADRDGLTDAEEVVWRTDPQSADTDGDGLDDGDEVKKYRTNPRTVDSDADGLTDGEEVGTYRTNPNLKDTDGDGFEDGTEVSKGYNPLGEGKL